MENDVTAELVAGAAEKIIRQDIVELANGVIECGAKVQARNLLCEFSYAYEFTIGLGGIDGNFANPASMAKSSLSNIKLITERATRILRENELAKFVI